MREDDLRNIAKAKMPEITPEVVTGSFRWNVIDDLTGTNNLGIELGVAAGSFSAKMVESGKFARFFGVDMYADSHNINEYKNALRLVGLDQNYHLLRMTFDQAIDLFPDAHFDFIYVDGYAHTGEEGGRTLLNWYAKLKPGGIMAGDDYDATRWPLVVWAVHNLVSQLGLALKVTDKTVGETYNRFRSWFVIKPLQTTDIALHTDEALLKLGDEEKQRRIDEAKSIRDARRAKRHK